MLKNYRFVIVHYVLPLKIINFNLKVYFIHNIYKFEEFVNYIEHIYICRFFLHILTYFFIKKI